MMRLSIDWRGRWRQLLLGLAVTLPLAFGVAVLSGAPDWQSTPANSGVLRLSFTHSGARDCRDRTEAELAALAKNMRARQICARRRAPVLVEMDVDGASILARELRPSGLAGSGPSRIYDSLPLPAGHHRVDIRMQDDPAAPGFTNSARFDLFLAAGQSIAIDFDPLQGGFFLH